MSNAIETILADVAVIGADLAGLSLAKNTDRSNALSCLKK